MTHLIQQKSPNDCVLASVAMAAGFERWEDAWTDEDLQAVIASKGVSSVEPWLNRVGYIADKSYREVYVRDETNGTVRAMLWRRRALISCDSLNNYGGSHMVYWDGSRVFDPHEGHWDQGFQHFRHITSLSISRVFVFDDTVPRVAVELRQVPPASDQRRAAMAIGGRC